MIEFGGEEEKGGRKEEMSFLKKGIKDVSFDNEGDRGGSFVWTSG